MAVFLHVLLVLIKECGWFVFGKLKQVVGIGDCEDSGVTGVSTTSSSYGASLAVSCPGAIECSCRKIANLGYFVLCIMSAGQQTKSNTFRIVADLAIDHGGWRSKEERVVSHFQVTSEKGGPPGSNARYLSSFKKYFFAIAIIYENCNKIQKKSDKLRKIYCRNKKKWV
jgi:hypothetical protein